jgi:hypothetical protein
MSLRLLTLGVLVVACSNLVKVRKIARPVKGFGAVETDVDGLRSSIPDRQELPDAAVFSPFYVTLRAGDPVASVEMEELMATVRAARPAERNLHARG